MRGKDFSELYSGVVKTGLCRFCGACALICPVDVIAMNDRGASLTGECISCGLCLDVCPVLNHQPELPIRQAFLARPVSPVPGAKTCGFVTTISCYLLEKGKVDAVLVSRLDTGLQESSYLARSTDEVYAAVGANYFSTGHLSFMKEAIKENEKVAVIGSGCCIEGAGLISKTSPRYAKCIAYTLGLFCSSQLERTKTLEILDRNNIDISIANRLDIRGGIAATADIHGGSSKLKLSELSTAKRRSCSYCFNLDNSTADISVGEMGAPMGHVIVLVRTDAGMDVIESSKERFQRISIPSDLLEALNRVKLKKQKECPTS